MANNKDCDFRTSIGGQALIEGILMRGPEKQAIVCRTAEGLVEKVDELKLLKDKYPIFGWPFIRGVINFYDSMVQGMKSLTYSAELAPEEMQEEPSKFDLWVEKKLGMEKAQKFLIGVAVLLGFVMAIGLFVFLPTLLVSFLRLTDEQYVLRSVLEGVVKIAVFLGYLWVCSRMSEIQRLFSYHGAEHKTIFCYEHGHELTVENVRREGRLHPRCGTSFLVVVILFSILIWCFIRISNPWLRMLVKLCLLPVIVSVTYELNRWIGRHDELWIAKILSWPGKQIQRITTNEPDDGMMEVAITALKLVIPDRKGDDRW